MEPRDPDQPTDGKKIRPFEMDGLMVVKTEDDDVIVVSEQNPLLASVTVSFVMESTIVRLRESRFVMTSASMAGMRKRDEIHSRWSS